MFSIQHLKKTYFYFGITVFSAFLLISCCTQVKLTGKVHDNKIYEKIALKKYKGEIDYLYNESHDHVICLNKNKTTQYAPHPSVDFFIFDIAADSIVFEQNSVNAEIKWINNTAAEVTITPEIINEDETGDKNSYVFDIIKKKKTLKKDF